MASRADVTEAIDNWLNGIVPVKEGEEAAQSPPETTSGKSSIDQAMHDNMEFINAMDEWQNNMEAH